MKSLYVYLICCLLSILSVSLQAQSGMVYGFKASYVLSGFMDADPLENDLTTNSVIPGLSFTLGMKHAYYFNEKRTIQLGFGLLYERNDFSRFKKWEYYTTTVNASYRKEKYRKHYLLAPLDFEFSFKKISFSAGVIISSLFALNLSELHCSSYSGRSCDFEEYNTTQYRINREHRDNGSGIFAFNEKIVFDHYLSFQYVFGIHYRISDRVKVGLEFRDYPLKNHFTVTRFEWDIFISNTYDHQTNAIDLSVQYLLE